MYDLLYKYLILTNKINLPGLGSFTIAQSPAKLDFVFKQVTAPKTTLQFSNEQVALDKSLVSYLQKQYNESEYVVTKKISDFIQEIKEGAANGGAILPGIGTLRTGFDNSIYFVNEIHSNNTLPDVNLNSSSFSHAKIIDVYDTAETMIITEKVPPLPDEERLKSQEKEDYWWVYAIVLIIMGIGALLYHYI